MEFCKVFEIFFDLLAREESKFSFLKIALRHILNYEVWLFYILNVSINPIINIQGWHTFQLAWLVTFCLPRIIKILIIEVIAD